jgi:Fe-S-cluster containining protein
MKSASFNLSAIKRMMKRNRRKYRYFLTRLEAVKPKGLSAQVKAADAEVWKETDCLKCANCCKTMTPTFTPADIKRIAAHLKTTEDPFKTQWLYKERGTGDWMNRKQPCQFLDLKNNKCSIYAVRPADCASFPHHTKKDFTEWVHVYKQNVEYCPATYRLVEKLYERL